MKILVTGGAGFIGSNLVHLLVRERPDWDITVLDLLTYAGNLENIATLIDSKSIKFVRGDIAVQEEIDAVFSDGPFDYIFHLAAESHVDRSIESANEFVRTNVLGTQNLLNLARAGGKGRFVHVSTDEVYGSLGPEGRFYESTPLDPTSPYSASKASSDLMVLAAQKTHDLDAVVTRCTNNYGPYQFPEKFIPLFVSNAMEDKELPVYGDGMQIRSWIHVEDHNRALLMVAEKGATGEIYNIGGMQEAELPNIHVAKQILAALGKPETLLKHVTDRAAHDRRYAVSTEKIATELGWKPQIPFETGLPETVRWYQENRTWWETIKGGAYRDYYERNYSDR